MAGLVTGLKTGRYGKYFFPVILWMVFAVITVVNVVQRSDTNNQLPATDVNMPPENQVPGFSYYRYDSNTNELCFAVSAGLLLAENAPIGIFKTAAAKVIKVKDFQLRYCQPWRSVAPAVLQNGELSQAESSGKHSIKELFSQLAEIRDHWGIKVDLSNIIGVTIDGFDCRIFDSDSLRLAVSSRRALIDSGWPMVTLRGHVIITGADGSVFESNHVLWDTQKQRFIADGIYMLRQGDRQISGKGVCVNSDLDVVANAKNAGG